jgi:hypothetical protein
MICERQDTNIIAGPAEVHCVAYTSAAEVSLTPSPEPTSHQKKERPPKPTLKHQIKTPNPKMPDPLGSAMGAKGCGIRCIVEPKAPLILTLPDAGSCSVHKRCKILHRHNPATTVLET